MKTTLLASAIVLIAGSAMAADVVYEEPVAPMIVAPVLFSWSGPYIGIQGGAGFAEATEKDFNDKHSLDGGLVGGFVGYQHQFDNNFVLGVEGDLDYNWNSKKYNTGVLAWEIGNELAGSVRARMGYAADRTLIYATGGWATTRGYLEGSAFAFTAKEKATFNGWTVGAGVDYAFTDNMFARAEYRYNDYGSKDTDFGKIDLNQHTVKVGLGVKF